MQETCYETTFLVQSETIVDLMSLTPVREDRGLLGSLVSYRPLAVNFAGRVESHASPMKQPRRLLFLVVAAARAVTDPLLETAIAGGQQFVNLDIRFGPDVYRIPVGVNATCDEKRRHLQGVMPVGLSLIHI